MSASDRDDPMTVGDGDAEVAERDRVFLVVYHEEPGRGARTQVLPLGDGAEVVFGRAQACQVVVDSEKASRTHARLTRRGASLTVEDLGSRNGTRVNGERITAPMRLASGDEIGVGPVTAIVGLTARMRRRTVVGGPSYLDERLEQECDRAMRYHRHLGLIMLRLTGAAPACEGAVERLGAVLRRMDCMAEYGADEFAIVLPEADRPSAQAAGRRLAREARLATASQGLAVHVGIAVLPEDGTQPGELLGRARSALRAARTGFGEEGVAEAPVELGPGNDVVVVDAKMHRLFALVDRVAATPMTVLLMGETGSGKEVVAEAIHRRSPRRDEPFLRVNCAAMPESIIERELFGHEQGAFTGADRRALGYFEAARGGTLFLDEVGEMPLGPQAKLLRVLESRRIMRLGGTQEVPVNVRVLCASNRDLEGEVERGRFRKDLYFRISAFALLVPALRERRADVAPLADQFGRQFARELGQASPRIAPEALAALQAYAWPGNVRELRNAIERAVVLATGGVILPEHLPTRVREGGPPLVEASHAMGADRHDVRDQMAEIERQAIVRALEAAGGNRTHAAQRLGLSRRALIYKLEKYGLKPPPARD